MGRHLSEPPCTSLNPIGLGYVTMLWNIGFASEPEAGDTSRDSFQLNSISLIKICRHRPRRHQWWWWCLGCPLSTTMANGEEWRTSNQQPASKHDTARDDRFLLVTRARQLLLTRDEWKDSTSWHVPFWVEKLRTGLDKKSSAVVCSQFVRLVKSKRGERVCLGLLERCSCMFLCSQSNCSGLHFNPG